ncbi:hypothetical protein JOE11_002245 [Robbsia andropogonis]|uniref:hypothetical protein n=1 Tax=Robbsia andropogonis TaxID=28092 RepID=UPI002A69E040|nr:hypothetical protein [Robbsia andropogonis]
MDNRASARAVCGYHLRRYQICAALSSMRQAPDPGFLQVKLYLAEIVWADLHGEI